ncbi:MAG: polysaccharide biosynthesis/export family protein [Francisellaceae bacterium]
MKKIGKFSWIFALVLSGCSLPGMHMSSPGDYSATINQENKIVKPDFIQIDAQLVLKQKLAELEVKRAAEKNYKKPEDFSTDMHDYDYRIGEQDELSIIVWDYQSLTNPDTSFNGGGSRDKSGFTVNAKGDIFYPYIGYVHVSGLTVAKARDLIAEKLSKYLKDPQVTVQVVGFNSQRANVIGAVARQRFVAITNVPMTVLDAVNAAGGVIQCSNGLTNNNTNTSTMLCADSQHVIVKQNGHSTTVDLDTLTAVNGSSENWVLEGGSVVYVPNNNLYKVYLLGDVKQTGIFNMLQGKMTLSDAIAAAGGVTDGSNPEYTYVIRSYGKNPVVYHINLKSPEAMLLAGKFYLKPQDVIFVSSSALKDTNQVLQYISPIISTMFSTAALAISVSK